MKSAEKKQLAKELYMLGNSTQKELAKRVKVTENTMSKWCKEWRPILAATKSTRQEAISRLEQAITDVFLRAEADGRALTDGEIDSLAKLNKVKEGLNKELGLSIIIQVFTEYNSYLMANDSELCRANNKFQDQYINIKASGGN